MIFNIFKIIFAVLVVGLAIYGAYCLVEPPESITLTETAETIIDTVYVVKSESVALKAIIDTIYAKTDTLSEDSYGYVQDKIARTTFHTKVDSVDLSLDTSYSYLTQTFLFDKVKVSYPEKTLYKEKVKYKPANFLTPTISCGFFRVNNEYTLAIGFGIEIKEKLEVSPMVTTRQEIGLLFSWRF
jgi:hypothetical protein